MTPDTAPTGELRRAVDLALGGDWQAAHAIVQEYEGDARAAWIHAVVHRMEGDLANARYWYGRAAVPFRKSNSAASEIEEIAAALERRAPVKRRRAASATRTDTRRSPPRRSGSRRSRA